VILSHDAKIKIFTASKKIKIPVSFSAEAIFEMFSKMKFNFQNGI